MSQVNGEGSFTVPGLRNPGTDLLKFTVINYVHQSVWTCDFDCQTIVTERFCSGDSLLEALYQVYAPLPLPYGPLPPDPTRQIWLYGGRRKEAGWGDGEVVSSRAFWFFQCTQNVLRWWVRSFWAILTKSSQFFNTRTD